VDRRYPIRYIHFVNPIKVIRVVAGETQARLARAAGTSQPTIAAYESETKSPTWRTVRSIAEAAGLACYPSVGPPMSREEARSVALHQEIAGVLGSDPERVLRLARMNVARMRAANPNAAILLDEWNRILDIPVQFVVSRMLDPSEHGRELRQVSPFAGVLDARQRAAVYRAFRDAA
jgi:DNA-binding XRE family transcriptional regulator